VCEWESRSLCQCFIVSSAGHPSRIRRIVNCYEHSRPFPSFALGPNWLPQRPQSPPESNSQNRVLDIGYWPIPSPIPLNLAKVSSFFCQRKRLQICFILLADLPFAAAPLFGPSKLSKGWHLIVNKNFFLISIGIFSYWIFKVSKWF